MGKLNKRANRIRKAIKSKFDLNAFRQALAEFISPFTPARGHAYVPVYIRQKR